MNSEQSKIYCLDSSAFIQLHIANKIVPIPDLWVELEKLFASGKIISHEFVFDELNPNTAKPDFIASWVYNKKASFHRVTEKQTELVTKILNQFPTFIDPEREKNEADPWVIALAIEKMEEETLFGKSTVFYVVSQEKISSSRKIPAVCRAFNVLHMNLDEFFRDNGWVFGIIK
jgi:hypothetical protein